MDLFPVSWKIILLYFFSWNFMLLTNSSTSKCKLSGFWLLTWKLTKFRMSFFKSQVSFSLNFATPFNVMAKNSSEIVLLKHYMIWTKRTHQCTIFRFLGALMKVHPIPHVIFETTRAEFILIWHHCSVSFKITPLYFFSSNLI